MYPGYESRSAPVGCQNTPSLGTRSESSSGKPALGGRQTGNALSGDCRVPHRPGTRVIHNLMLHPIYILLRHYRN